jgi:hypothetical protein
MALELNGPVLGTLGIGKFSNDFDESSRTIHSLANIGGYIPIIGLITGIFRIIFGVHGLGCADENVRAASKVMICRGILESLGLGILMAPVDIGCSLARLVKDHNEAGQIPIP